MDWRCIMAITIAVALQKGGVGRSTTAETIAAILGSRGKHVLLVDLDSQMNVTFISGIEPNKTITDVFTGDADLKDAIYQCKRYDLLAADEYLAVPAYMPSAFSRISRDIADARYAHVVIVSSHIPRNMDVLANGCNVTILKYGDHGSFTEGSITVVGFQAPTYKSDTAGMEI